MNEELKKRALEIHNLVTQKTGVASSSVQQSSKVATPTISVSDRAREIHNMVTQKVTTPTVQPQKTYTPPSPVVQQTYNQPPVKEFNPQPFKPTGEVISAQKDTFAESLFDKLPSGARTILSSLKESVFGAPVRGTSDVTAGLLRDNPLIPFLTRSPEESTKLLEEELIKRGTDPIRAANIAIAEYQQKQGADILTKAKIEKELALNDEEKSAISFRNLMGGAGLALDVMGVLPVGQLAKAKGVATTIAKSADEATIATLLKENIPNITDDVAEQSAVFLKEIKEPESVETALNRLNYRFNAPEARPVQEIAEETNKRLLAPKNYDDYVLLSKERPELMSKTDRDMLETLTEVRKYPTLKEYEDTFDTVYHGGEKIDNIDMGKSNFAKTFFMSDKPEYAAEYAGKYKDKGVTNKVFVSKDAKLLDIKNAPESVLNEIKRRAGGTVTGKTVTIQRPDGTSFELPEVKDKPESGFGNVDIMDAIDGAVRGKSHYAEAPGLVQIYKDMGYDGMVTYEDAAMRGKNIGVWNKEKLQTESELKDTWNKAHDKTPEPEQPLDFQFGEPKKTLDETVSELQKDYTGKRERRWEKKSIKDVAKKLGRAFELPAIFFEKRGLAKTIYNPIRDAQGKAQVEMMNILNKFAEKGLYKHGGVFKLGGFDLSKKEAQDMSKYMLNRQGKGYEAYTLEKLTPKTQEMVKAFDEVIAEMEPQFRKAAEDVGIDVGRVPNYAPLMTKEDINVIDDGIQPQWLLPHDPFFSTKGRVEDVPLDMYEPDYRLVMQRWIKGITDFNNVAPQTKRATDMLDTQAVKDTLSDVDMKTVQKYISDITTPDVPKTDAGKIVVQVNRYARRAQALAALGYNIKTILKQPLAVIAATVIEKAPPKLRSEYAKAFGVNVKDLPSVSIRGGDINVFNDVSTGSLMSLPFQPLKKVDQKTAEKILNGFLDKEWKAAGKGMALSPETMAHIEREAQKKVDMLMGGYFAGQRPPAYTSEIGNTILMFTYPVMSQLNTFFYHVYKGKTTPDKAKRIAEVMTSIALIAYFEQVVTNLSFNWDDEEDMMKDILISASGNIPVLGNMVFAAANPGIDYQPVPVVGNINKIKETAEQGKFEKTAWEVAHLLGVPRSLRRGIEGAEVIEEGGYKGFAVETLPEQIRTAIGGQYGSLAGKEYLDEMYKPKGGDEVKELKKLPPEEAKTRYLEIKRENPALARSIKQQLIDDKLGTTKEEKEMRNMNVADGERVRAIYNKLEDFDTKEEKVAYLKDLQAKKVLTEDVLKQLKALLKKD